MEREQEAGHSAFAVRKLLTHFPLSFRPLLKPWTTTVYVGPSVSINLIWKLNHRHAQKLVSMATPSPIKLTITLLLSHVISKPGGDRELRFKKKKKGNKDP